MDPLGLLNSSGRSAPALSSVSTSSSQNRRQQQDPVVGLASNCILQAFGPTVQLIADSLHSLGGPVSLLQLEQYLEKKCPPPTRRWGVLRRDNTVDAARSLIRASLLTLIQHNLVTFQTRNNTTLYRYHANRATFLMRYAKYVEFMKKAVDETAAAVIQCLLLNGRLQTVDLVLKTVHAIKEEGANHHHRYTARQKTVEVLYQLVTQGFVEQVEEVLDEGNHDDDDEDGEEAEFDGEPPVKRIRYQNPQNDNEDNHSDEDNVDNDNEDPAVMSLLNSNAHYNTTLPVNAMWRANLHLFHDYFRAYNLGRLVAERYGSRIQSCGSLVTAALKHRAHLGREQQKKINIHSRHEYPSSYFAPSDIVKYLPKPVLQLLERKAGGLQHNLSKAWEELSQILQQRPRVVLRVASGSGNENHDDTQYTIDVSSLLDYLQERVIHQLVYDRHGEVAARVVSILMKQGWLESEVLADHAMLPAKDTREILHQLYRDHYVDLLQLSSSRQKQSHNPASTVYLWGIHRTRLKRQVRENVATACLNIRLRQQHESEVGKEWIEREQQKGYTDENDHETDRLNYQKFCLGMERLEYAALQLDETLMVMKDFGLNEN